MTTSSSRTPGLGQPAQPAGRYVRATSPAKSRVTVRLPDLSAARTPSPKAKIAEPGNALRCPDDAGAVASEGIEPRKATASGQDTLTAGIATGSGGIPARRESPSLTGSSRFQGLSRKTLEFVRQPKFWLACVVAVAVQIVLAFVMTPADAGPDGEKRMPTSAKSESKKAEEPAARIVVPAAPANLHDERSDLLPGSASPMGPTSPQEPTNDAGMQSSVPLSETGGRLPAARMAENRQLGDESADLDHRSGHDADGATLGGIAPLEPGLPAENQGHLR
jgi:hypothetical protein